MSIAELLLPEFRQEMAGTRKTLERVPEDKLSWKAYPKSNTIGWVACHLVEIPGWVEGTLTQDSWDIHPVGGEPYQSPVLSTRKEMIELFDRNVEQATRALSAAKDECFFQDWSLLKQGKPFFTMPRYNVIRGFVLNHTIHHRAFLCAYLRLNDLPVPSLYGPSGDE